MIGYIGLVILISGYVFLIIKKDKYFAPINFIASIVLTIHAVILNDIPFIIVNGLVAIMLAIKTYENFYQKK